MALAVARRWPDVEEIVTYVERSQTPDGGYFFARVPPANAADTYHAVQTLRLLEREPRRSEEVRTWLQRAAANGLADQPRAIFHLTQAGLTLGMPEELLREWAAPLCRFENPEGGFGHWRDLYVEIPSELETTYFAFTTLLDLGMNADHRRVKDFVLRFQNPDGGFGGPGHSTLASAYYAVAILNRVPDASSRAAGEWLRERERKWALWYLEDVYWLVMALGALNVPVRRRDDVIGFLKDCQHPRGGFTRSRFLGIATLEYTHYAVAILRALEAI